MLVGGLFMQLFYRMIMGILLGAGAILPGISSGVLCVIFGIYDKLVDSILGFFNDIKKNLTFLFPILFGVGIGVIIFGNVLKKLFYEHPIPTQFAFIGLILGCVPNLFKIANSKKGFRLHYLLYTGISFIITLLLLMLESNWISSNTNTNTSLSSLFLVLSGFIMSAGVIIPGVSSTVLLMILGTYETYLNAVSMVDLSILVPMGIGLIFGGLVFLKLTQYVMHHYFAQTYYTIIGFVLGSLLVLYPGFEISFTGIISLIIFVLCFFIGKIFEKAGNP